MMLKNLDPAQMDALANEGFVWMDSLTTPDTLYVLPGLFVLISLANMKVNTFSRIVNNFFISNTNCNKSTLQQA